METLFLTLHIIGAGIFIGIVVFSLLLTVWKPFTKDRLRVILAIRSVGIYTAVLMLLSGIFLYLKSPDEFNTNLLFWIKMGLFVFDGLFAILYVDRKINNNLSTQDNKQLTSRPWTFLIIINLIAIFTIVTLGVILTSEM